MDRTGCCLEARVALHVCGSEPESVIAAMMDAIIIIIVLVAILVQFCYCSCFYSVSLLIPMLLLRSMSLTCLFVITTVHVQRHGVVIETCMVGASDSAFLQQAAHITGGLYLRPRRTGALLQYLLVSISDFSLIEYIQPMVWTYVWLIRHASVLAT